MLQANLVFSAIGDRPDAPNMALIFTDGNSNVESEKTIPNAIDAREQGDHIVVFGVGRNIWNKTNTVLCRFYLISLVFCNFRSFCEK